MQSRFRVAGISFEHMHMAENLRMVVEHPQCDLVGICDVQRERMQQTIDLLPFLPKCALRIGSTASKLLSRIS